MQSLTITSAANPRFRAALRLRQGRVRRREGRFLVDGLREIGRAIAAGLELQELYVATGSPSAESLGAVPQILVEVPQPMLDQIAYGDRNEGAVAVFATPQRTLDSLRLPESPLIVVLDQVEKPGNVGAVFRSADAAGAHAVLLSDCVGDLFNPNLIRASLGTVFTVPAAQATANDVRQWLQDHQVRMLATRVDATATLWETDWRGPAAIVIGSEAAGLGQAWAGKGILGVRVPMAGVADSLNASVTAAICLFEAARQRATRSERDS